MTLKDIVITLSKDVLEKIEATNKPVTIESLKNQIFNSSLDMALDNIPETIQTQNLKRQIRKELNAKKVVVYFDNQKLLNR